MFKSGPLRVYFQLSEAKIRVFEQNTEIIKFWFWGGEGVTTKEKYAASSREIAGKFRWLPGLIENPAVLS